MYGSEQAREMLRTLPEYGVDAIALVPYGWTRSHPPSIRVPRPEHSFESDVGIEDLSRLAHQLGIKVMLKPHLGGRSRLELSTPQDRARWFAEYGTFLEHYARLATRIHADLFCLGVEMEKVSDYEAEWRRLAARVRVLYPGPLVYAANWGSEFETIRFWDALDYIGLDNYYPLPDDLSTEAAVERIGTVQRRFNRPVVFTEAGFSGYAAPQRQPWDETPGPLAPEQQARCYEALFRAFYNKPWFYGVYWWKVGTNGYGGAADGSHTPWRKPAMGVVKRWYTQPRP